MTSCFLLHSQTITAIRSTSRILYRVFLCVSLSIRGGITAVLSFRDNGSRIIKRFTSMPFAIVGAATG